MATTELTWFLAVNNFSGTPIIVTASLGILIDIISVSLRGDISKSTSQLATVIEHEGMRDEKKDISCIRRAIGLAIVLPSTRALSDAQALPVTLWKGALRLSPPLWMISVRIEWISSPNFWKATSIAWWMIIKKNDKNIRKSSKDTTWMKRVSLYMRIYIKSSSAASHSLILWIGDA